MKLNLHCIWASLIIYTISVLSIACDDSNNRNSDSSNNFSDQSTPLNSDQGLADQGLTDQELTDQDPLTMMNDMMSSMSMMDASVCPEGEAWLAGACVPVVCEPSAQVCRGGALFQCNEMGTALRETPVDSCRGRTCIEGECRPIKHNVAILFDTSESMNKCVANSNGSYVDCCGGDCPAPWPVCETADNPLSRIGHSKKIFNDFFSNAAVQLAGRFSLLTFPQTEIQFNNQCYSSIYDFNNIISGDQGLHETPEDWFLSNFSEVVRVPFAKTWAQNNLDEMIKWVDFVEELEVNPEIRATGLTPLGRSMFYAGEYFRHVVIAEGRPCDQDVDCGSQDYVCIDGSCTDPVKHCRLNLLLVFTDGKESTYPLIDEFFNPVVQARRMKFGLSCSADQDCLADSVCDQGYCRRELTQLDPCDNDAQCPTEAFCLEGRCTVPGFLWPTNQGRCNQAGNPCVIDNNNEECSGFFEQCTAIDPLVFDREQGANQLRGYNGEAISITTHVINVSDEANESRLIGSHGGGLHFQVDISDSETMLRILNRLADYKAGGTCALDR